MNNTERLIQRYRDHEATPAERLELETIAAEKGVSLEALKIGDSFETFYEDFEAVEVTEGEFDRQSFHQKRLSPTLPIAVHDSPEKPETKVIPIKPRLRWLAAAATVTTLMLAAGLLYYINHNGLWEPASITYKGKGIVTLPDNSTVTMNEGSELTFSRGFGESDREVFLTGEALFDVQRDPTKPFIVHTGTVQTTVLGTTFNIKANEGRITVTVVEGRVQVGDDRGTYGQLGRNEQIEVDVKANNFTRRNVIAEEVLMWQDVLIPYDITFFEAVVRIEKHFNVKVTITNDSVKNCKVTASIKNDQPLQKILEILDMQHGTRSTIKGNMVIIEGGNGCNASE